MKNVDLTIAAKLFLSNGYADSMAEALERARHNDYTLLRDERSIERFFLNETLNAIRHNLGENYLRPDSSGYKADNLHMYATIGDENYGPLIILDE